MTSDGYYQTLQTSKYTPGVKRRDNQKNSNNHLKKNLLATSMMAAMASPVAGNNDRVTTLKTLLEFHERNVFSMDEIRKLVCRAFGMQVP